MLQKTLIAAIALLPLVSNAQIDKRQDLPRWYQIELLIFAQNRVDTEEVFRDNPFNIDNNSLLSQAPAMNPLLNKLPNGRAIPVENSGTEAETSEAVATLSAETPTFIAVTTADFILDEHRKKLRWRDAYRVLWHGAWQQAMVDNSPVSTYSLSAGRLLLQPQDETELATATPTTLDALLDQLAESPSEATQLNAADTLATDAASGEQQLAVAEALVGAAPANFRELQGSFKIYKTRFAHLELDLWFTQIDDTIAGVNQPQLIIHPLPEQKPQPELTTETNTNDVSAQDFLDDNNDSDIQKTASPAFDLYYEPAYQAALYGHIKEDRRLRPKELYYIDHPLFGAIVKMVAVPHPSLRSEQQQHTAPLDPLAF